MRHRRVIAALFALVTLFFAIGIKNVHIQTIFSHLLPKDDPFVKDSRTLLPIAMVSFDRRGDPYRSFDGAYVRSPAGT
jgi:hypothetical protein